MMMMTIIVTKIMYPLLPCLASPRPSTDLVKNKVQLLLLCLQHPQSHMRRCCSWARNR
jgi:hypothetical protein